MIEIKNVRSTDDDIDWFSSQLEEKKKKNDEFYCLCGCCLILIECIFSFLLFSSRRWNEKLMRKRHFSLTRQVKWTHFIWPHRFDFNHHHIVQFSISKRNLLTIIAVFCSASRFRFTLMENWSHLFFSSFAFWSFSSISRWNAFLLIFLLVQSN